MSNSIPTLQLRFDNGPRKGESHQCKASRPTRIGRVVKGNTLAVKDQGISQKHLILEFLPNISRWAVTDLDTSNGTLVNALPVPPSTPSPLADGDIIKIGETTSISVHISEVAQADALPPTRRRGRSAKEDAPDPEPEASTVAEVTLGRSVRRGRAAALEPLPQPSEEIKEAPRVTRRGGRAATVKEQVVQVTAVPVPVVEAEPVVEEVVLPRRNPRRGKRVDVSVSEPEKEDCLPDPIVEIAAEECGEVVTRGMGRGRRGTGRGMGKGKGRGRGATVNGMGNDDGDGGGVEEVRVVEPPAEEMGNNWEDMTLGQWLDRMETLLPQTINEAADEMIAELRSMASRFDAECLSGMMG